MATANRSQERDDGLARRLVVLDAAGFRVRAACRNCRYWTMGGGLCRYHRWAKAEERMLREVGLVP